jgi:hypothetical protein
MLVAAITFSVAATGKWGSVGGQLLASVVLLASGYQDIGPRSRIGSSFGFFMALAFGVSALITSFRAKSWSAVAICIMAIFVEGWLILRWRRRISD